MSENQSTPRSLEQLDKNMELSFREGDIGATALLAWEILVRFPSDCFAARLYVKKLLRDQNVSSIDLETFTRDAKILRENNDPEELAKLAALGLLRFPAQRYLTLSLVDAAEKLQRSEWIPYAIRSLGDPKDDDIVLLNAVAALAQTEGDFERAEAMFSRLFAKEPNNETLIKNYSASLVGVGKRGKAINLLEESLGKSDTPRQFLYRLAPLYHAEGIDIRCKLAELDEQFFAGCETSNKARTHADVSLFLQDFDGVHDGLSKALELTSSPTIAFELAECEIATNALDIGLDRYGVRFEAFPYLKWFKEDLPVYRGQSLEQERLFVWAEQGVGDEVMFSMFLEELDRRAKSVTLAVDPRLIDVLKQRYPSWIVLNRFEMPESPVSADFACPMGDLMVMFMPQLLRSSRQLLQPAFEPQEERLAEISRLLKGKNKPRIAITWRGGTKVNGKIRSMPLSVLMSGVPEDADLEIISLQYDEDEELDVRELGDRRVALSGLNNRSDLEGVFCLLRCCDAVVTVDNAVAHFAAAIGVPTAVLVPAGQIQFRWKNEAMRRLLFPSTDLFVQRLPGDWTHPVNSAWNHVLSALNLPEDKD